MSIGGAVLLVALMMVGGTAGTWAYLFGPAILGCVVAGVARGRLKLLALGAAVALALALLAIATMDPGERAEGGAAVVAWWFLTLTAGLVVVGLLLKLVRLGDPDDDWHQLDRQG